MSQKNDNRFKKKAILKRKKMDVKNKLCKYGIGENKL